MVKGLYFPGYSEADAVSTMTAASSCRSRMRRSTPLPDSCGILLWLDKQGRVLQLEAAEKMFSHTAAALQRQLPLYFSEAASVAFFAAVGPLHMLWLKAQLAEQYADLAAILATHPLTHLQCGQVIHS